MPGPESHFHSVPSSRGLRVLACETGTRAPSPENHRQRGCAQRPAPGKSQRQHLFLVLKPCFPTSPRSPAVRSPGSTCWAPPGPAAGGAATKRQEVHARAISSASSAQKCGRLGGAGAEHPFSIPKSLPSQAGGHPGTSRSVACTGRCDRKPRSLGRLAWGGGAHEPAGGPARCLYQAAPALPRSRPGTDHSAKVGTASGRAVQTQS